MAAQVKRRVLPKTLAEAYTGALSTTPSAEQIQARAAALAGEDYTVGNLTDQIKDNLNLAPGYKLNANYGSRAPGQLFADSGAAAKIKKSEQMLEAVASPLDYLKKRAETEAALYSQVLDQQQQKYQFYVASQIGEDEARRRAAKWAEEQNKVVEKELEVLYPTEYLGLAKSKATVVNNLN